MLKVRAIRERGVTLIELAVTLTILGLLLMVAVPGVGSWIRNSQVRAAAESLQNGIQRARSEALRRNENVTFWLVSAGTSPPGVLISSCTLSSSSASWVVSLDDPAGKCTDAPSQTVAPRILEAHGQADGSPSVTTAAFQSDGTTAATNLTFNGFGRTVGTGIGRVNVTNGDARRLQIVVSTGGGVRLCDLDVSDATDPRKCPT